MRRLRPLVPFLLAEMHRRTDVHHAEIVFAEGMLVEIDLAAVGRFEKAVSLERENLCDASHGTGSVRLLRAAEVADMILELPAGGVE